MASEPTEQDLEASQFGSVEEEADYCQENPEYALAFMEKVQSGEIAPERGAATFEELIRRSAVDGRTGLKNEVALLGSGGKRGEISKLARECERAYLLETDELSPDKVGEAKGKQFAIVVLDLEGFKSINQKFGQERGNQVLKETGAGMIEGMRPGNEAYRLGGGADEFALLLPDVDTPELAERIVEELERHLPVHPVTGEPVRFNREKRGIEIYDSRRHGPMDAPGLFAKALEAVREDDTPAA